MEAGFRLPLHVGAHLSITDHRIDRLEAALIAAGMSEVPHGFSVAPVSQEVSDELLAEMETFIRVFDRVTTRASWQRGFTASDPPQARQSRGEVCFFSAWDFHLPPEEPGRWQLIEFNDNGSGELFAARINQNFHALQGLEADGRLEPPQGVERFNERLAGICLLYTSPSPRDATLSRMPSSA